MNANPIAMNLEEEKQEVQEEQKEQEGPGHICMPQVVPNVIPNNEEDAEHELAPIQLFPAIDEDEDEDEDDVVLVPVMPLLQLPGPPVFRRSNTIVYQDGNQTIFNGNPNGSRL
jgi:hypothetical protein